MPDYKYHLKNGKVMTLTGDTQPSDNEVEAMAKQNNLELLPVDAIVPNKETDMTIPTAKSAPLQTAPMNNESSPNDRNTPDWYRDDGTKKGDGFYGLQKLSSGKVASEFSVADSGKLMDDKGNYLDYPTMIPGLTKDEFDAVLRSAADDTKKTKLPDSVYQKAEAFALARKAKGLPLFATPEEEGKTPIPQSQGLLSKLWHGATDPLTDLPSRFAQGVSNYLTDPNESLFGMHENGQGGIHDTIAHGLAMTRGGIAGAIEGAGDIATSATSPINLAIMALTGGASIAKKQGLDTIASGLSMAARAGGLPMIGTGAKDTLSKDSTLSERAKGLAEIAGGLAVTHGMPDEATPNKPYLMKDEIPTPKPRYRLDPDSGMGIPIDEKGNQIGPAVSPKGDPVRSDLLSESKFAPKKTKSDDVAGTVQQVYDAARGLMSVDPPFVTSAAWRQGIKYSGTPTWFKAWGEAAKAYGSKALADAQNEVRLEKPLFKPTTMPDGTEGPSYAEQVGLRTGDLSRYNLRDENIKGELAEKIPVYGKMVAASNRAYNAFINHISTTKFEDMINTAVDLSKQGKAGGIFGGDAKTPNPMYDLTAGKAIAEFVNTSLNRGKLGFEAGPLNVNLEKNARLLSNTFFSPRTISSQVRMLNPSTYLMTTPQIRKEYIAGMVRQVGMWWTMAQLSRFAGAQVSTNPTSADFGKIKIGNTRIDPPGGLQQYLVLGSKMMEGGTTPTTTENPKFSPFGQGYKPETRTSQLMSFGTNRLHPTLKVAYDLFNAQESAPFHVMDRTLQLAAPMFADDLASVLQDDPKLAPIVLGASGVGMGTQNYTRGSFGKPTFIPSKYDWNIGAKKSIY